MENTVEQSQTVESTTIATPTTFHFRTTDKETGKKRESLTVAVPMLTVAGLISIIETGGPSLALLLEAANDVITSQVRQHLDTETFLASGELDHSKLDWNFIANIPKADRVGGGIPKAVWEAFAVDYKEVMPQVVEGLSTDQAAAAAKLFVARLQPVKTNKPLLAKLQQRLDTWFASTPKAEDFGIVYESLTTKINTLISADDASLLDNI